MPSTPPRSTCGCAFILKGIKSSKQALTLLLMHERFWTSVKNLPSSKAVSLCLAEEVIGCPQLGHGARRVCMPELIAHGLPCKCPGYPRITYHIPPNGSALVRAGVLPLSWKSATAVCWYLVLVIAQALGGWKINLGTYMLALRIGCLRAINILALEMIHVETGEGLVMNEGVSYCWCLHSWVPVDPPGELMSLKKFKSLHWEHLDFHNGWIWTVKESQVTLICRWGWMVLISVTGQIEQLGERDLFLLLVFWKSIAVSCTWLKSCHFVMFWYCTSCNNKIIQEELFLAYLESYTASFNSCVRTSSGGAKY